MNTARDTLITVRDAMARLRIARSTVYVLIAKGDLDALKIGAATRITEASVQKLIDRAPGVGRNAA
jgi:excisionase family DNA binding protein